MDRLPQLRVAGEFPYDARDFTLQHGPHPFHSLHLYGYDATIRIGRRQFALSRGDVTLTPAGNPSLYDLPKAGHHYCLQFFLPPSQGTGTGHVALPLHMSMAGRHELARSKFRWIAHLWRDQSGRGLSRAAANAALLELLIWMAVGAEARRRMATGPRAVACVERAAELIAARSGSPLDVPRLAQEVGMSQNYLARAFRSRFGVTMAAYLLDRRMEVATHLLETTELPVSLVGQRVGLDNPHHFNKRFRDAIGMSPTAYRMRSI